MRNAMIALLGCGSLLAVACADEGAMPPSPPPTFAQLQPLFFSSLQLQAPAVRAQLPAFEAQLDQAATALIHQADQGALTTDADKDGAGRALFYASFVLQAGQQAVQDGIMKPAELFMPHRYAPANQDHTGEYLARLARGAVLLDRSDRLRARDNLSESVQANLDYQAELLRSDKPSQASIDALLAASGRGFAGVFNAMIMWRDPELHSMTAPYMEKLLATVCSPFRFACDNQGMSPMPPGGPRTLTVGISGPVLASDLLVRRAEAMLHRAEDSPAARSEALAEALQRLKVADSLLGTAQRSSQLAALSHYPFTATLAPRRDRLSRLLVATQARIDGTPQPPALPSSDYYRSTDYRLPYQCVGCHTRGPTSQDVPQ